MSIHGDWENQSFRQIFEAVCKTIEERQKHDPGFTIEELKQQLQSLYILEGQDWLGRGRVADIDIEASIAACQHMASEWEKSKRAKEL